jgi:mono/diheme cytochrome c family protein
LSYAIVSRLDYAIETEAGYAKFRDNCLTCHAGYQATMNPNLYFKRALGGEIDNNSKPIDQLPWQSQTIVVGAIAAYTTLRGKLIGHCAESMQS